MISLPFFAEPRGDRLLNYIIAASTDAGIVKDTNQDSLFVRTVKTPQGRMVLAVICDGMGGYDKGEVASASLLNAFSEWMDTTLSILSQNEIEDSVIRSQWDEIVTSMNEKIMKYGKRNNITLGTTVVSLLLTDKRYYIMNVGDSRVYEIVDELRQITNDHTVVANDLAKGLITPEQAKTDPRRDILLQCVGVSEIVSPDYFFGDTMQNAVYMLCSDGFRNEIETHELFDAFHSSKMTNADEMKMRMDELIGINKQRNEKDNISVITIRTF